MTANPHISNETHIYLKEAKKIINDTDNALASLKSRHDYETAKQKWAERIDEVTAIYKPRAEIVNGHTKYPPHASNILTTINGAYTTISERKDRYFS